MDRTQRLRLLAIAAGIAIVAVVVIVATSGGGNDTGSDTTTGTVPVLHAGKVTAMKFTQGDQVTFKVKADKADEVHVHGYDLMKDAKAGETLTFSFKATITGVFEIEFEGAKEKIGELAVEPK
jgi:hypothetical protein